MCRQVLGKKVGRQVNRLVEAGGQACKDLSTVWKVKNQCVIITLGRTHARGVHIVPCARPYKVNGDAGPYGFMPMPGLATSYI